jgi:hypothetical protein
MTTSNKCQGTIHTCEVSADGFGTTQDFIKTQRARLERLERQWREWTAKYSGGAKSSEEYAQAYEELADMTEELGKISKMTNLSGVFGQGGFLVSDQANNLGNLMASQYNVLLTRNLPGDLAGVREGRRENALEAWGMMKGAGMVAGTRGLVLGSRVQMMRDVSSSLRKYNNAKTLSKELAAAKPDASVKPPFDNAQRTPGKIPEPVSPPVKTGVAIGAVTPKYNFKPPLSSRHKLKNVKQKSAKKNKNTVAEPHIDMKSDIEGINRGLGSRDGNLHTINGRTYEVSGDHLVPHSGPGFHPLNRGEFEALGIFNTLGNTPRAFEIAQRAAGNAGATKGLEMWRLGQ